MIDIHCHLLFGVDDGSGSFEESCRMLEHARRQDVRKIILTPHYRHGMFPYRMDDIVQNFDELKPAADSLGIDLYLGCECHVDSRCVEKLNGGRCLALADSHYVLTEYSHVTDYSFIYAMTEELMRSGYRPVIAHVERYPAITDRPARAAELRRMGALIQVNADAVLGLDGRNAKRFCKRLFHDKNIDMIASDSHGVERRPCHMKECRDYVLKRYGAEAVKLLFYRNPGKILRDRP